MDHAPHSRPQSVDSVNLGSTYSGFFPAQQPQYQHQHRSLPYNNNQPQQNYYEHQQTGNIPPSHVYPQQSQYLPQQYASHVQHNQQYNVVPPQQNPPQGQLPYYASTNQASILSPQQQPPSNVPGSSDLSYQYAASAAATAAFYHNLQQQQNALSTRNFKPIDAQPLENRNGPQSLPVTVPPVNQWLQQQRQPQGQSEYYKQYYAQYYQAYYNQVLAYQQHQQQAQVRQKTPLKYGSRLVHAKGAFSSHNNQLLVVEPNSRVAFYNLQEIFTEKCYSHLFLQTLLVQDEKKPGKTLLPLNDIVVAQDWIRIKLLNDKNINYELKLILKVIQMLFRQNGTVSPLDLSGKFVFYQKVHYSILIF